MKLRLTAILASAMLLLVVSVLGITRGLRASAAYLLYHNSRYGSGKGNVRGILSSCSTAYRYYPYNYFFTIWTAQRAYTEGLKSEGEERKYFMSAADYWCERGLNLNPYKGQLRMIRARLLAEQDPASAVEYWQAYVDWHYWEPFNHCALAEFHAMAGDFTEAFKALELIKGMEHYEGGLRRINDHWRREMAMPDLDAAP